MLKHELLVDQAILIVMPETALEKSDFEALTRIVDAFLVENHRLNGLMIYTETFPGWSNFTALLSHLTFVKDHHRFIKRVAAVTDSSFLSILPSIADHFVEAEVKHFDYLDKHKALRWLQDT